MNYEQKYNAALGRAKEKYSVCSAPALLEYIFPELKESEDESIKKDLMGWFEEFPDTIWRGHYKKDVLAWIEKQGEQSVEPKWCHHKVDLSDCSEEYRKAYYDGWNNCNMQHSQCNAESDDVVKCLINGMNEILFYEHNEEAMWGTEKFSMKVKDILNWLEKQGEQPKNSVTYSLVR